MSLNLHNLKTQFVRNRAKTVVLAILGVALLVLVGRALFPSGPRSATAIALIANPQDFPAQPITDPIVEAEMISRLEQSKILWSVLHEQGGLSPAQTFMFDPSYYALDPAHRVLTIEKSTAPTIDKPAATAPSPVVAATTLRSAKELLARLQLQSTIMTASPIAVINGQIVRVGESIGDFRVTAIQPREVTLTLDGNPFVLQMNQPERDKPSTGRPF